MPVIFFPAAAALSWGVAWSEPRRLLNPWALLALAGALRSLSVSSPLESAMAGLLAAGGVWGLGGEKARPTGRALTAILLPLGLLFAWAGTPWLGFPVLLPLALSILMNKDWSRGGMFACACGMFAMILSLSRAGDSSSAFFPPLLFLSLAGLLVGGGGGPWPLLAWAGWWAAKFPEQAAPLLPWVALLPWYPVQGGKLRYAARVGLSAALAFPLILESGFLDHRDWLLWVPAVFFLLLAPDEAQGRKVDWIPPAGALVLSVIAWVWTDGAPSPWRGISSAIYPSVEFEIPSLSQALALSPFLTLAVGALAAGILSLSASSGNSAGWTARAALVLASGASLVLAGRLTGAVGGLYLGEKGGGPLLLGLDSLGALLSALGLAYAAALDFQGEPFRLLLRGGAIALLLLSGDLVSACLALFLLSELEREGPGSAGESGHFGSLALILGAALLSRSWGSAVWPDFAALHDSESAHPLTSVAYALLAAGATLVTGLFRSGRISTAGFAAVAWLWRGASRCPSEAFWVLGALGMVLIFGWVQGRFQPGATERRGGLDRLFAGLSTLAAALALGGMSPQPMAQGALFLLALCLALPLGSIEGAKRFARVVKMFLFLAGGLGLFFFEALRRFLSPAASLLTGP